MTIPPFVEIVNGIWCLKGDDSIRIEIQNRGRLNWDDAFLPVMRQLEQRPFGTVIDIGAFIGDSTAWFRSYPCIAFEPQADAFTCLMRNAPGVDCYPFAAGNSEPYTVINGQQGNLGARGVTPGGSQISMRIDDLGLEKVALIKIDVEGWEPHVLDGCAKTIERCKPMVVVEVNAPALERCGFKVGDITDRFAGWTATEIYRYGDLQFDLMYVPA